MKPKFLVTGSKIALVCLALLLVAAPLIVVAQPLPLDDNRSTAVDVVAPPLAPQEASTVPQPTTPLTRTMGITQTLSDEAQRNTIAFDGLAFLTGSLGADSFFPPGKVADFWGFQYLRDNDPSEMGHNPLFLTSAAFNMWNVLTTRNARNSRRWRTAQVSAINDYGYRRFVLMKAFRRLLEGDVPTECGIGQSRGDGLLGGTLPARWADE